MRKREQIGERCGRIGREIFALLRQKSSVPPGCVLAAIRVLATLADMNNYLSRAASWGLLRQNSNGIVKYHGSSV